MSLVIAVSRWVLPLLAVVILIKCLLPLLLGHPQEKTYGYLTDNIDGARYPLNMWETSIGRSKGCDIVIGYPTVSRFQAVISRRIDGWYVYDLNSKSGIQVGGKPCEKKAQIRPGDTLTFGGAKFRFEVINDPVIRVGKRKGGQTVASAAQPAARAAKPQPKLNVTDADTPLFSDFYDAEHKPQLRFQRTGTHPTLISESPRKAPQITPDYTGTQHVETAPRKNAPPHRTFSRPTLTNPATKQTYLLTGNRITIGRSRACDLTLDAPTVSRRHAVLVLYEDGWAVEDSASTYGTFLNGTRVQSPQLLFDGDVLQFGDERLRYNAGKVGSV